MKKMSKVLSVVLAVVLVAGMIPSFAFAKVDRVYVTNPDTIALDFSKDVLKGLNYRGLEEDKKAGEVKPGTFGFSKTEVGGSFGDIPEKDAATRNVNELVDGVFGEGKHLDFYSILEDGHIFPAYVTFALKEKSHIDGFMYAGWTGIGTKGYEDYGQRFEVYVSDTYEDLYSTSNRIIRNQQVNQSFMYWGNLNIEGSYVGIIFTEKTKADFARIAEIAVFSEGMEITPETIENTSSAVETTEEETKEIETKEVETKETAETAETAETPATQEITSSEVTSSAASDITSSEITSSEITSAASSDTSSTSSNGTDVKEKPNDKKATYFAKGYKYVLKNGEYVKKAIAKKALNKAKVSVLKGKKIKVTVKKVKGAKKYQVRYKANTKKAKWQNTGWKLKKVFKISKKLKKGKKVVVQYRAKNAKGKKSNWSKKVVSKKKVK